jgi:hypothetical protein
MQASRAVSEDVQALLSCCLQATEEREGTQAQLKKGSEAAAAAAEGMETKSGSEQCVGLLLRFDPPATATAS